MSLKKYTHSMCIYVIQEPLVVKNGRACNHGHYRGNGRPH